MSETENVDEDVAGVDDDLTEGETLDEGGPEMDAAPVSEDSEEVEPAPSLTPELEAGPVSELSRSPAFMGVPIEILICVGKAKPLVSDLVKLRRDSVISLESNIEDPVEIYIGDRLIARGELQEMEDSDGQLGVRLTEVADLSNGV